MFCVNARHKSSCTLQTRALIAMDGYVRVDFFSRFSQVLSSEDDALYFDSRSIGEQYYRYASYICNQVFFIAFSGSIANGQRRSIPCEFDSILPSDFRSDCELSGRIFGVSK